VGPNPKSSARAKRPPRTYPSSGVYGTYPSSGMYVVGWLHARSNQPHPSEISDGLVGNSSCPINGAMLENLSRVVGPLSLGTLPVCEHYVCEREPNCTYPVRVCTAYIPEFGYIRAPLYIPRSGMYAVHPSEISDGLVGNSSCPINGAALENLSRVVGP